MLKDDITKSKNSKNQKRSNYIKFSADGGRDLSVTARIRSAWKKFREYSPILTGKGFLLELKGKYIIMCEE